MTSTAAARDSRRRQQQLEAAARARAARVRRRRRQLVGGGVAVVLVVVGAMLAVSALTGSSGSKGSSGKSSYADGTAIAKMLIATPSQTLSSIGVGTVKRAPVAVQDAALTSNGKPEILYLGADYCPFCAAERWPLVLALGRFGTFSHIGLTTSAHQDVFPDTATFSFHDVGYRSDYLSFVARELYDNVAVSRGHYRPLDKATNSELALLTKYGSSFPLVDFAGRYVQRGASYDPGVLKGMSADDIAMSIASVQSPTAQGVGGAANMLTAAICSVTKGQPANVCTDPAVVAATSKLHG
ncbi:MAG TPA: DUF929 family protein [Mycobacteriales bacterium]|nr:DUF929 family protein [Mycobacteriales bacterium]